jgi:hypothetical protein
MKLTKFNNLFKKHCKDIESFLPYNGKADEIFFMETFLERETLSKIKKMISEGREFKAANIATKEQIDELGIQTSSDNQYYFSLKSTPFTKPAIIPA